MPNIENWEKESRKKRRITGAIALIIFLTCSVTSIYCVATGTHLEKPTYYAFAVVWGISFAVLKNVCDWIMIEGDMEGR